MFGAPIHLPDMAAVSTTSPRALNRPYLGFLEALGALDLTQGRESNSACNGTPLGPRGPSPARPEMVGSSTPVHTVGLHGTFFGGQKSSRMPLTARTLDSRRGPKATELFVLSKLSRRCIGAPNTLTSALAGAQKVA